MSQKYKSKYKRHTRSNMRTRGWARAVSVQALTAYPHPARAAVYQELEGPYRVP